MDPPQFPVQAHTKTLELEPFQPGGGALTLEPGPLRAFDDAGRPNVAHLSAQSGACAHVVFRSTYAEMFGGGFCSLACVALNLMNFGLRTDKAVPGQVWRTLGRAHASERG